MLTYKLYFSAYFWILAIILFIVGGLGIQSVWVSWSGVLVGFFSLALIYMKTGKILFPRHFNWIVSFYLLLASSLFWSRDPYNSVSYVLMFLAGGGFYLYFYNLANQKLEDVKILKRNTLYFLVGLGLFFLSVLFLEYVLGTKNIGSFGLIRYVVSSYNHHHLGDYWVIVLLICIYKLISLRKTGNKLLYILLIVLSVIVFSVSRSRSALFAVAGGVLWILTKREGLGKFKKYTPYLIIFTTIFVLFLSSTKSLLFSRPYYFQAVEGVYHNWFGVGLGNFDDISRESTIFIANNGTFSSVAHNLVFEVFVGLGVFGFVFVVWLYRIMKDFLKNNKDSNELFSTVFIAISINFLFDFTYFIPTMLWIWFVSLGLSDQNIAKQK